MPKIKSARSWLARPPRLPSAMNPRRELGRTLGPNRDRRRPKHEINPKFKC